MEGREWGKETEGEVLERKTKAGKRGIFFWEIGLWEISGGYIPLEVGRKLRIYPFFVAIKITIVQLSEGKSLQFFLLWIWESGIQAIIRFRRLDEKVIC